MRGGTGLIHDVTFHTIYNVYAEETTYNIEKAIKIAQNEYKCYRYNRKGRPICYVR